ncbi:hypothetical protein [Rhodopseudomonas palustris]|uniref:hypothetical protein n=1 Tax=Rhodopseudomonas palustris TaxID=1076 RepID=UPI0011B04579|nr:hypothetical protein [Rhodopseudomonas palustris]
MSSDALESLFLTKRCWMAPVADGVEIVDIADRKHRQLALFDAAEAGRGIERVASVVTVGPFGRFTEIHGIWLFSDADSPIPFRAVKLDPCRLGPGDTLSFHYNVDRAATPEAGAIAAPITPS